MTRISSLSHFSALYVYKIVSNVSQLKIPWFDHLLFTWEWWQRVEGGRTARPDLFSPSFPFFLLLRQLFLLHFSQLFTFLLSPSSLFLFHFPPNSLHFRASILLHWPGFSETGVGGNGISPLLPQFIPPFVCFTLDIGLPLSFSRLSM